MGIRIDAAAFNNIGDRKNNEDSFYLDGVYMQREAMDKGGIVARSCSRPSQIYAVFDGMGGANNGEDASSYAAVKLHEYQKNCEFPDHSANLKQFLQQVSEGINDIAQSHGLREGGCGSTAAMVLIGNNWYRTAHVGDSRVYLLREGELIRLTKDQSEVQRMVDAGQITIDQAWDHPRRNVITRHLGMALHGMPLDSIIGDRKALYPGDLILICSDGIHDSLRDAEIQDTLDVKKSAEQNAIALVKKARARSNEMNVASDNITAIVLKVKQVADRGADRRHMKALHIGRILAAAGAVLCATVSIACIVRAVLLSGGIL